MNEKTNSSLVSTSHAVTVGILGADWYNKGAEAMMRTVIQEFKTRNSQTQFVVFVTKPGLLDNNPFVGDPAVTVVVENAVRTPLGAIGFVWDTVATLWCAITGKNRLFGASRTFDVFMRCDVVIGLYGYVIHNKNKTKVTVRVLLQLLHAKLLHKRYYFFPQDVDYVHAFFKRLLVRFILPRADYIAVRGRESQQQLAQMIGGGHTINIVPDIAFLLQEVAVADSKFEKWKHAQVGRSVLALSVNEKVRWVSGTDEYRTLLGKLIQRLVIEHSFSVVLLPHDVRHTTSSHDLRVCTDVLQASGKQVQKHVHLVDALDYSPAMYKWLVGKCDVMLASRFHMAVASLGQNVPTATLGWAFKYRQLLRWFLLEEYAFDGDSATVDQLVDSIQRLLAQKSSIQKVLRDRNREISQQVTEFFDKIVLDMEDNAHHS